MEGRALFVAIDVDAFGVFYWALNSGGGPHQPRVGHGLSVPGLPQYVGGDGEGTGFDGDHHGDGDGMGEGDYLRAASGNWWSS